MTFFGGGGGGCWGGGGGGIGVPVVAWWVGNPTGVNPWLC